MLATKLGIVVTTEFVGGFGLDRWDLLPATVLVDSDEDEVSAGHMEVRSGLRIFDPDFNAHFKRCIESTVDAGLEDEQIADVHGLDEVDVIHGRGDNMCARMAVGGDGPGDVDEMHETAAEQVAKSVGVIGENDLSHLRLSAGDCADRRVGLGRTQVVTPTFTIRVLRERSIAATMKGRLNAYRRSSNFQFRQ
jgi:hypothetical protein